MGKRMDKKDINGTIRRGIVGFDGKDVLEPGETPAVILANGPAITETKFSAERVYTINMDGGAKKGWVMFFSVLNDYDRAYLAARKVGSVMTVHGITPENIFDKIKNTEIKAELSRIRNETYEHMDGLCGEILEKAEKSARKKTEREAKAKADREWREKNGIPEPVKYRFNSTIDLFIDDKLVTVKAIKFGHGIVIYQEPGQEKSKYKEVTVAAYCWDVIDPVVSLNDGRFTYGRVCSFGSKYLSYAVEFVNFLVAHHEKYGITPKNTSEMYQANGDFAKEARAEYREIINRIKDERI